MSNKANVIIFVGALPHKGHPPLGGGEQGNSRTVEILEASQYTLKVIRRIRSDKNQSKVLQVTSYPWRVLLMLCKLVCAMCQYKHYNTIVHYVGFYGTHIVVVDDIALWLIKIMGYKVVYEIRGAGIIDYNNDESEKRHLRFNYALQKADYIFSQGMDNKPLVDRISPNKEFFYYPNYVEDSFLPSELLPRELDTINIVYFGRLDEGKNILMLIDTIAILIKDYNNIHFTIIGNGSAEYVGKVLKKMNSLPEGICEYKKGVEHSELKVLLERQHFFVFPTEREGHSNALTEAMALGVVPIVSDRGFNATILNNDDLVVKQLTPKSFAQRISDIIQRNSWKEYSDYVHQRVLENYTYTRVSENLIEEYQRLFCNML